MITALSLSPAVDRIYFVDNFEAGQMYRVKEAVKSAGGKGINVARVAAILGEKVSAIGYKAGQTGSWLEGELKKLGVNTSFIEVEGESRTNNNIIDRVNSTETEVLEMGPYIKPRDIDRFLEVYTDSLKHSKVIILSGGLPQGITANFYGRLIEIARSHGIKTILDSSGETLAEGIKSKPYMVKPNLRELISFAGKPLYTPEEIAEACTFIISQGVELVVASLGAEGAVLVSKELTLHARVPAVKAVNTIGSGDSMVAGFAAGLHRELGVEGAFKLGLACGISNTQFVEIGVVDVDAAERYLGQIELEVLQGKR